MADAGLFIGWGGVAADARPRASTSSKRPSRYYGGLQQSGTIESIDAVFLEPHGGDLGGFFLIKGERAKLAALRVDDEFIRISARAGMVVDGFGRRRRVAGRRTAGIDRDLPGGDLRARLRSKQGHGQVCHPPGRDRI